MTRTVSLRDGRWGIGEDKRKSLVLLLVSSCSLLNFFIFWWCESLLCSVQYVYDFVEDWAVFIFTLLADELNVSQLSKVEVSLLLQSIYGLL